MALALRDGITFCQVGGRCIFLDRVADRYFCFTGEVEAIFLRLAGQQQLAPSDHVILRGLMNRGILVACSGTTDIQPCPAVVLPQLSLLDEPPGKAGAWAIASACSSLMRTRFSLKRAGLHRSLQAFAQTKSKLEPNRVDAHGARRSVAAFWHAGRASPALNDCLVHSLAVAQHLLSRGLRPNLILGVQVGPFQAHCWVQHGDRLVNDRFDTVRTFTPILVL